MRREESLRRGHEEVAGRFIRAASLLLIVGASAPARGDAAADQAFLERHWRRPIPPQGVAPVRFSPLEKSLAPVSCGTCHPAQLTDWKTSLHAQSMGPGVAGQLVIGREVTPDLSREVFDTRLPPGKHASFSYRRRLAGPGPTLRVTVTVHPDHFYTAFFKSLLGSGAGPGAQEIHEALEATRRSAFDIFSKDVPLT